MDRRQFLGTAAAVGTAVIVPKAALPAPSLRSAKVKLRGHMNAKLRLYYNDALVLETDTSIDEHVEAGVLVYGKSAKLVIKAEEAFTFNRVTVELEDIPKEISLPLSRIYTVTPGNTLILQSDANGLVNAGEQYG